MLKEFNVKDSGEMATGEQVVCCMVETKQKLEWLLSKYKDLILEDDELPIPDRYYKKRTFRLGLEEDKRDKIFFRPQYPPHPEQIPEYKKLVEPLIKAGVYQVSDSPHNNPVMLVAKKTPGQFRLVVDNRLVKAQCRPVGAMSATPLGIIRLLVGGNDIHHSGLQECFLQFVAWSKR